MVFGFSWLFPKQSIGSDVPLQSPGPNVPPALKIVPDFLVKHLPEEMVDQIEALPLFSKKRQEIAELFRYHLGHGIDHNNLVQVAKELHDTLNAVQEDEGDDRQVMVADKGKLASSIKALELRSKAQDVSLVIRQPQESLIGGSQLPLVQPGSGNGEMQLFNGASAFQPPQLQSLQTAQLKFQNNAEADVLARKSLNCTGEHGVKAGASIRASEMHAVEIIAEKNADLNCKISADNAIVNKGIVEANRDVSIRRYAAQEKQMELAAACIKHSMDVQAGLIMQRLGNERERELHDYNGTMHVLETDRKDMENYWISENRKLDYKLEKIVLSNTTVMRMRDEQVVRIKKLDQEHERGMKKLDQEHLRAMKKNAREHELKMAKLDKVNDGASTSSALPPKGADDEHGDSDSNSEQD